MRAPLLACNLFFMTVYYCLAHFSQKFSLGRSLHCRLVWGLNSKNGPSSSEPTADQMLVQHTMPVDLPGTAIPRNTSFLRKAAFTFQHLIICTTIRLLVKLDIFYNLWQSRQIESFVTRSPKMHLGHLFWNLREMFRNNNFIFVCSYCFLQNLTMYSHSLGQKKGS